MKEIIFADGDGSDYLHSELYETEFATSTHLNNIFTKKIWKGNVKITIESIDSSNAHKTKGCGKTIMVKDGNAQHQSFCGCTYKGLHLCDMCDVQEASNE